jgi:S-adenosylmethionine:tRNA ribosyltransferase-isomerase
MKVDAFDFELPSDRIASRPVFPRDRARLLVVGDRLEDRIVAELPELLAPGDLLVCNDTRVIPAQLVGRRGAARISVTLHRERAGDAWDCFARPAKKLKAGDRVVFAEDLEAEVTGKGAGGEVSLRFNLAGDALRAALERHGSMPLPPYIAKARPPDDRDRVDYQTVFAARDGAVAAPTAGLHFTPALLERLAARDIGRVMVTLHVGAGTFLPIKVADTEEHRMYPERGAVTPTAAAAIAEARASGGRVVAVGSTSLRLLEAAADADGQVRPFDGETSLFITPGYSFRTADLMLTNFHLPRSTLFMLVAAFAGLERMRAAYEHAKAAGYRFYSYGDCTLLQRADR